MPETSIHTLKTILEKRVKKVIIKLEQKTTADKIIETATEKSMRKTSPFLCNQKMEVQHKNQNLKMPEILPKN